MNDLSSDLYSVNKNIRFKIIMLRSDLCDYSDAYIVVKGTIDLLADDANKNDKAQETVAFKNNALFRSYFSKINSILIDIAEYLNIVMTIYNLLEYSQNYPMTSEIVRSYYVDKIDDVDDNASDHKSFEYKTNIRRNTTKTTKATTSTTKSRWISATIITMTTRITTTACTSFKY